MSHLTQILSATELSSLSSDLLDKLERNLARNEQEKSELEVLLENKQTQNITSNVTTDQNAPLDILVDIKTENTRIINEMSDQKFIQTPNLNTNQSSNSSPLTALPLSPFNHELFTNKLKIEQLNQE